MLEQHLVLLSLLPALLRLHVLVGALPLHDLLEAAHHLLTVTSTLRNCIHGLLVSLCHRIKRSNHYLMLLVLRY